MANRDAPEPTGDEAEDLDMEMPKVYEPIPSFNALEQRLQMFLTQYNEIIRGAGMDLVFFKDAMIHLTKVWERENKRRKGRERGGREGKRKERERGGRDGERERKTRK